MYTVVKLYQYTKPLVVEQFDDLTLAQQYADVMTKSGKGTYIVLMPVPKNEERK
jgi:hypothetical protein